MYPMIAGDHGDEWHSAKIDVGQNACYIGLWLLELELYTEMNQTKTRGGGPPCKMNKLSGYNLKKSNIKPRCLGFEHSLYGFLNFGEGFSWATLWMHKRMFWWLFSTSNLHISRNRRTSFHPSAPLAVWPVGKRGQWDPVYLLFHRIIRTCILRYQDSCQPFAHQVPMGVLNHLPWNYV